jgi:YbbR domain-containing protein
MNKPLIDKLLDDWPVKILSLAGAVVLFFTYQLNRLEERPLSVALRVITNDDFVPASPYPPTVRLVIRGEPNVIFSVLDGDLEAVLDLTTYTAPGVWRIPVRVEKRGSALGVDPLEIRIEPGEVTLTLEPRAVKELQIVPSFRGFLASGHELTGFRMNPPRIEAVGPSSLIAKLGDATTEAIELSGRSEPFTVTTRVVAKDPLISYLSTDVVEFTADVRKAIVFKTFQDIPVEAYGLQPDLMINGSLPVGSVRVSAARSILDSFVPTAGLLRVELSQILEPGVHTIAVVPVFPEGFKVESWLPMVVALDIVAQAGVED